MDAGISNCVLPSFVIHDSEERVTHLAGKELEPYARFGLAFNTQRHIFPVKYRAEITSRANGAH